MAYWPVIWEILCDVFFWFELVEPYFAQLFFRAKEVQLANLLGHLPALDYSLWEVLLEHCLNKGHNNNNNIIILYGNYCHTQRYVLALSSYPKSEFK